MFIIMGQQLLLSKSTIDENTPEENYSTTETGLDTIAKVNQQLLNSIELKRQFLESEETNKKLNDMFKEHEKEYSNCIGLLLDYKESELAEKARLVNKERIKLNNQINECEQEITQLKEK